jgi:4-hydroxy-3-methylbut-2-enyl diphosphate reductase
VDLVLAEIKRGRGPYMVYGQLVHNPQVIEALAERGVSVCEDPCCMDSGTLFLRTHGVTLDEKESLEELPVRLRDLICPKVKRALELARRMSGRGYDLVILGDEGHQEVRAIRSYAGDGSYVISGPEDVDRLPELERPFLLSQTTQDTEAWERSLARLRERFGGVEHANTICGSTRQRQQELRELCRDVDCVVVVGGRNSANTRRLAAIASEEGLPVYHVETADELSGAELSDCRDVLLTAGASTPSWSIRKVRERLHEIQGLSARTGYARRLVRDLVFSSVHVPPAAVLIGLAGWRLLNGGSWLVPVLSSSLVLFAMHLMNSILETGVCTAACHRRQEYIATHRRTHVIVAAASLAGALVLAAMAGIIWVGAVAVSLLAFLLYSLPLVGGTLPVGGLRALPGARDILFALAWSVLLGFLPGLVAAEGSLAPVLLWSAALFWLFLARSVLVDLVDLQGDALMGLDTIPLKLGESWSVRLLMGSSVLSAVAVAAGVALERLPVRALGFLVAPAWVMAGYCAMRRSAFPSELGSRFATDGSLFAAGIATLAATLVP